MENILQKARKIHCIGINGSGLSALAGILSENGKTITGSDSNGIAHHEANITDELDLVIYSAAISQDNVEIMAAKKFNLPLLSYPEALGFLTDQYTTIAICGTHGKTTTTAMVATILMDIIDPTVILGSNIHEFGDSNYRCGKSEYLIIEACEYQRHFLNYHPDFITITNIEIDHLDYFLDENDYRSAFESFIARLPRNGRIIANFDDKNVRNLCEGLASLANRPKVLFFDKYNPYFNKMDLSIPGHHNIYNAIASLETARQITDINIDQAIKKLNGFMGAGRRFETFKRSDGKIIIDDYAHHPTAIKATLAAARDKFGPDSRILCVFQPHQYSRTIKLFNDFATSFGLADEVIIPNIYQVRDNLKDISRTSPEKLAIEISKHHKKASYGFGLDKTLYDIQNRINDFDVIIIMGAGDITRLTKSLI
ncbi:UDP-N-acetylmuramate--L-alanine ligase [Patescibacteria group bacterium]|nr:UDP-N-acetylmuramate--L-alanine ligase [Patescibacteria group bacterium]